MTLTKSNRYLTLLVASLLVATSQAQSGGFVAPRTILPREPFTFAAQGVVEGDVVMIQTVEGEVVQRHKADSRGRVFLAAGLAAGTYLLSASDKGSLQGKIEVKPQLPPLQMVETQRLAKIDEPVWLPCASAEPNAGQLKVEINGKASPLSVLASNSREAVLASPASVGMGPGRYKFRVVNPDGSTASHDIETVACKMMVKLDQTKVASGGSTSLSFKMEPKDVDTTVRATVLSGPIHFGSNSKEATLSIKNGLGSVPVQTIAGSSGPFQIGWLFMPDPRTEKILEELAKSRRKEKVNSDKSKTVTQEDEKGRVVEKQKLDKDGNETYYESHQFDENGIDRFEQKLEINKDGSGKHRIIKRNARGDVISDEENTFDKDGNHTGGTRTTTDIDGNTKTETYDPETNTWK